MTTFLQLLAFLASMAGEDAQLAMDYMITLESRVKALEARVAELSERVANGRKQLRLIVRETNEDLGISVDGALAAWNDQHGVIVDYSTPRDWYYFDGPNCTGTPYYSGSKSDVEARFNRYLFIGDGGRLFRPASTKRETVFPAAGSQWDNTAAVPRCQPVTTVTGFRGIEAAFTLPRQAPELLDVQLR